MSGKIVDLCEGKEEIKSALNTALDSHKEYVEAGDTSLAILSVGPGGDPAFTFDIARNDKLKMLCALHLLLNNLIE